MVDETTSLLPRSERTRMNCLQKSAFRINQNISSRNFAQKMPQDIHFKIFEYLTFEEKRMIRKVCKKWRLILNNGFLWDKLDFSKIYYKTNDNLIKKYFTKNRYHKVRQLSLKNCSTLTDQSLKFISLKCKTLTKVDFSNCVLFSEKAIFIFLKEQKNLQKIELFGDNFSQRFPFVLKKNFPLVDFGDFWIEYCIKNGIRMELKMNRNDKNQRKIYTEVPATCFLQGKYNSFYCIGRIKGKILHQKISSQKNKNLIRKEIKFCCETHWSNFMQSITECPRCDKVFAENVPVCFYCQDFNLIDRKENWVKLELKIIEGLKFFDIVSKIVSLNLEQSLPCSLELHHEIPNKIMLRNHFKYENFFYCLKNNKNLIDLFVLEIKYYLLKLYHKNHKRAILIKSADNKIKIYSDKRTIQNKKEEEKCKISSVLIKNMIDAIIIPFLILITFITLAKTFTKNYLYQTSDYSKTHSILFIFKTVQKFFKKQQFLLFLFIVLSLYLFYKFAFYLRRRLANLNIINITEKLIIFDIALTGLIFSYVFSRSLSIQLNLHSDQILTIFLNCILFAFYMFGFFHSFFKPLQNAFIATFYVVIGWLLSVYSKKLSFIYLMAANIFDFANTFWGNFYLNFAFDEAPYFNTSPSIFIKIEKYYLRTFDIIPITILMNYFSNKIVQTFRIAFAILTATILSTCVMPQFNKKINSVNLSTFLVLLFTIGEFFHFDFYWPNLNF